MTTPTPPTPIPGPARPVPESAPPVSGSALGHRLRAVSASDRTVLLLYAVTRIGVWLTAYCADWLFVGSGEATEPPPLISRWEQWDWLHFRHIAQDGYFPDTGVPDNREAFFPGFPLLLRAVRLVVPSWTVSGLLISFVAGAVAVLALARIARAESADPRVGPRAVFFLLLSPCAVFLAAGYSEALFLALALTAWSAARADNVPRAAVLACLATTVRINGLFLAAALVLHFVLAGELRRRARQAPWLALPVLPVLIYFAYLHERTGDWMAWQHAQERGWYRQFHAPWVAWQHTWEGAFSQSRLTTTYALLFQAELVAMLVGLALVAVLVARRRWPEAVYVGLSLWALGTSYWYMSIPRASLLWWPLWILLARWSLRRPHVWTAYVCVAAPLATVLALAFASGRWAG
ncbi:mannosyltransferase family protein [Embleya sp. AB8]|uniref:mannosyltransferase family protein n=1 Tax=Embleya sp. AB8 TaxID=3156304 RepID=UPI003C74E423